VGTFNVAIEIGNPAGETFESLDALVDTGASYTVVPGPLLERLGVTRETIEAFVLADGRTVEFALGETRVRIDGRTVTTLVVFGAPDVRPLLGAYTLEGLRLAPDPVNRRLVPAPPLLVALSRG
jgi:clan AA aspartic protease